MRPRLVLLRLGRARHGVEVARVGDLAHAAHVVRVPAHGLGVLEVGRRAHVDVSLRGGFVLMRC